MTGTTRAAFKACSLLLQYPTDATFAALDDVDTVAASLPARRGGRSLGRMVAWMRETSPESAAARYVETFDFDRRASLYLTYYAHGDTRDRGAALLALRAAYRAAGYEMCDAELPDYLPVMLELAALSDAGVRALDEHRAALEALHAALRGRTSPYADAVDAVRAQLPRVSRRAVEAARRMVREGPPAEQVGLEPFAPPEIVTGCGGCGGQA
jgi:nitrate reductase delta subunit